MHETDLSNSFKCTFRHPVMKTQKPDTRFLHLNNSEQCLPMQKSPSQCHSIVGCCLSLAMCLLEVLIDLVCFYLNTRVSGWFIKSRQKNIQIQFLNDKKNKIRNMIYMIKSDAWVGWLLGCCWTSSRSMVLLGWAEAFTQVHRLC